MSRSTCPSRSRKDSNRRCLWWTDRSSPFFRTFTNTRSARRIAATSVSRCSASDPQRDATLPRSDACTALNIRAGMPYFPRKSRFASVTVTPARRRPNSFRSSLPKRSA